MLENQGDFGFFFLYTLFISFKSEEMEFFLKGKKDPLTLLQKEGEREGGRERQKPVTEGLAYWRIG